MEGRLIILAVFSLFFYIYTIVLANMAQTILHIRTVLMGYFLFAHTTNEGLLILISMLFTSLSKSLALSKLLLPLRLWLRYILPDFAVLEITF